MQSKICSKCGANLPLSMFRKKKEAPSGLRYECKVCQRDRERKFYRENENRHNRITSNEKADKKYSSKNPLKRLAKNKVNNAVKSGKLIKQSCQICGNNHSHAHHSDYDNMLDVMWLCPTHHKAWHRVFIAEAKI